MTHRVDEDPDFLVAIGADVRGRESSLGEVEKVIVDPTTDRMTGVVVKHGKLFASERILPLDSIRRADGSVLYVYLDEEQFSELDNFEPLKYRGPDPDYSGPPGFDRRAGENFNFASYIAMGPGMATLGQAVKPLGYPGGEQYEPASPHWDTVSEGDDVVDRDGEKVGELRELRMDVESGTAECLVVREGFLFHRDTELPGDVVAGVGDGVVRLRLTKDEVEERHARA